MQTRSNRDSTVLATELSWIPLPHGRGGPRREHQLPGAVTAAITSAIATIRSNKSLPAFGGQILAASALLNFLVTIIINGLSDGALTILAKGPGHPFPSIEELITLLQPAMSMRSWGIYLKLGSRLPDDLPLLI